MAGKMFQQVILIQLLLLCVQVLSQQIYLRADKPEINVWITNDGTESKKNYEKRPPVVVFHKNDHIPRLDEELTDFEKNVTIERKIIKANSNERLPFFGMLPLFIDVGEGQYEVGKNGTVRRIPSNRTFRLACLTYGIHCFDTIWVDGKGQPLASDRRLTAVEGYTYCTEVLTVTAEKYSTSYGCKFSSSFLETSITKWFSFALITNLSEGSSEILLSTTLVIAGVGVVVLVMAIVFYIRRRLLKKTQPNNGFNYNATGDIMAATQNDSDKNTTKLIEKI